MGWVEVGVGIGSTCAIAMGSAILGAWFTLDRASPESRDRVWQRRWFSRALAMLVVGAALGLAGPIQALIQALLH